MLGFGALGQFALGQPGQNATANGAILVATASLVAGAASGAATANGATISAALSLVGGVAIGDTTAPGAAVVVSVSIIPGTATGSAIQPVPVFAGVAAPMPRPILRRNGRARGDLLVAIARLRPGRASTVSLLPGQATGDARSGNVIRFAHTALIAGSAAGESNLQDDELLILLEAA